MVMKEEPMQCTRCSGFMVPDHFIDLADDSGQTSFQAWRCVICGNVVDPLILKNRVLRRTRPAMEPVINCVAEGRFSQMRAA